MIIDLLCKRSYERFSVISGMMYNMRYKKGRFVQCNVGYTMWKFGNVLENGAIREDQIWIRSLEKFPGVLKPQESQ